MNNSIFKNITRKTLYFGLFGAIGALIGNIVTEPFEDTLSNSYFGVILSTTIWSAVVSFGIALALIIGQNIYLKRSIFSRSLLKAGFLGVLTGAFAGSIAQVVFSITSDISVNVEIISRIICWGIFGMGTGWGISIFVPNYPKKTAMIAGFLGGMIGGAVFRFSLGFIPEMFSRFIGVFIIGLFIGLMISIFEELLREAWLTIEYGNNERTYISLGEKPIVIGSSPKADIYLPKEKNYPPVTAIIKVEKSKVIIENKIDNKRTELRNGSKIGLGFIEVIVNTK